MNFCLTEQLSITEATKCFIKNPKVALSSVQIPAYIQVKYVDCYDEKSYSAEKTIITDASSVLCVESNKHNYIPFVSPGSIDSLRPGGY